METRELAGLQTKRSLNDLMEATETADLQTKLLSFSKTLQANCYLSSFANRHLQRATHNQLHRWGCKPARSWSHPPQITTSMNECNNLLKMLFWFNHQGLHRGRTFHRHRLPYGMIDPLSTTGKDCWDHNLGHADLWRARQTSCRESVMRCWNRDFPWAIISINIGIWTDWHWMRPSIDYSPRTPLVRKKDGLIWLIRYDLSMFGLIIWISLMDSITLLTLILFKIHLKLVHWCTNTL